MTACSNHLLSIDTAPTKVVNTILSYIENPFTLATVMTVSKQFNKLGKEHQVWERCIQKWGITEYKYDSDPKHEFTALEVAQYIGAPMKNIRRIVNHILDLKTSIEAPQRDSKITTAGSWLCSLNIKKTENAQFNAISDFLFSCGLPVSSDGLVSKKLPTIYVDEKGPHYNTKNPIISMASVLSPDSQRLDLLLNTDLKKREARRVLFLTRKLLELTLYKGLGGEFKDTSSEVAKIHIDNILSYTHKAMHAYFQRNKQ